MRPRYILAAGWVVFLVFAYPGHLTVGTADQLVDSRTGAFTDWHPVMMTEVWRILGRVLAGPPALLFFHSQMLLLGTYYLVQRWLVDRAAAVAAVCVLLFPPIAANLSVIDPAVEIASFLIAAAAALGSERRSIRCVGLFFVFIACGISPAGGVGALPIVLGSFRWRVTDRGARKFVIGACGWACALLLAVGVTHVMVDERTRREDAVRAMVDIVGILRYSSSLEPARVTELLRGVSLAVEDPKELRRRAQADYLRPALFTAGDSALFADPITTEQRAALDAARHELVRARPMAYLHHRLAIWKIELGFTTAWHPLIEDFVPKGFDRNQLGHAAFPGLAQRILLRPVRWLSHTLFFRAHLYLGLALVLVVAASVRRRDVLVWLLASGIGYEVALMFETSQTQFVDSTWLVVMTIVSTVIFTVLEVRHQRIGKQTSPSVTNEHHV